MQAVTGNESPAPDRCPPPPACAGITVRRLSSDTPNYPAFAHRRDLNLLSIAHPVAPAIPLSPVDPIAMWSDGDRENSIRSLAGQTPAGGDAAGILVNPKKSDTARFAPPPTLEFVGRWQNFHSAGDWNCGEFHRSFHFESRSVCDSSHISKPRSDFDRNDLWGFEFDSSWVGSPRSDCP